MDFSLYLKWLSYQLASPNFNNCQAKETPTQLCMTLIGVLAGAIGGVTLAETLALRLRQIPTLSTYSEFISFVIVVLVIAYLTLILGELVPKMIALSNPERTASAVASYAVCSLAFLRLLSLY